MPDAGARARPARTPRREIAFRRSRRSGTIEAMDPQARLAVLRALAALPLLAFLPLVLATLLVPLGLRGRR
jgi:hypothetical protein